MQTILCTIQITFVDCSIDTASKTVQANIVRPGVVLHYGFILLTFFLEEQDALYFHRLLTSLLVDKCSC